MPRRYYGPAVISRQFCIQSLAIARANVAEARFFGRPGGRLCSDVFTMAYPLSTSRAWIDPSLTRSSTRCLVTLRISEIEGVSPPRARRSR